MPVRLLCLAGGERSAALLKLAGTLDARRYAATVAMYPAALAESAMGAPAGLLVIDCLEHADYDVCHLIALMRSHRDMGIAVWVDNHEQRLRATAAGADLGLRPPIAPAVFRACLQELSEHYARAGHPAGQAAADGMPSRAVRTSGTRAAGTDGRRQAAAGFPQAGPSGWIDRKPVWRLSPKDRTLEAPSGMKTALTPWEGRFLAALFAHPRHRLAYEALKEEGRAAPPRTLPTLVSRLRRKCRESCMDLPLQVERGVGYVFLEAGSIEPSASAAVAPADAAKIRPAPGPADTRFPERARRPVRPR